MSKLVLSAGGSVDRKRAMHDLLPRPGAERLTYDGDIGAPPQSKLRQGRYGERQKVMQSPTQTI